LVVRLANAIQESRPDDAAAAPDGRHCAAVDAPAELSAARLNVIEALRVRDHLRRVQRGPHVLDERIAIIDGELADVTTKCRLRGGALLWVAGQRASERCFGDAGDRDAEVECTLHGPTARPLLFGLVDDYVHER